MDKLVGLEGNPRVGGSSYSSANKKFKLSLNPHVSSNDVTCVSLNVVASVL